MIIKNFVSLKNLSSEKLKDTLIKSNPVQLLYNELKIYYDDLDYNNIAKLGFPKLAYVVKILTNPNDELWNIATEVAQGKNEATIKTALKQNETKFYLSLGVKGTTTILTSLQVISLSNPITTVVVTALNLFNQLANFGSITAIQRTDDAEKHLDKYRKLVPNLIISDKAKFVLHSQIQKLRQLRPKCKSLTKNCQTEHIRYWIIGQMFRELINYYNTMKIELFTNYNETMFIELCNYENINLEKYINDYKNYINNLLKENKTTTKQITKKQNSIFQTLFNFIDEIFTLIFKKV